MEAFTSLTAIAIPFDQVNVDTDQIIPARFLRKQRSDPDYCLLYTSDAADE